MWPRLRPCCRCLNGVGTVCHYAGDRGGRPGITQLGGNLAEVEKLTLGGGRKLEYILAVPASRYKDFGQLIDIMDFAEQSESVRESTWEGCRLVVVHNPEMAKTQTDRRRQKLDELVQLGDRLAQKLDTQEEGQSERGRRASDRGACSRFSRAVHEAHFNRFIQAQLDSDRFTFNVNESALAQPASLDGKLVLITNVSDCPAEDIVARYKALADIERGFKVLKQDIAIASVFH